jgi:hypothetical protein
MALRAVLDNFLARSAKNLACSVNSIVLPCPSVLLTLKIPSIREEFG